MKKIISYIPFIWAIFPIYIMLRFLFKAVSTPANYHHLEIMHVWYEPIFTGSFRILGSLTIIAAIVCIGLYISQYKGTIKEYIIKSPWMLFLMMLLVWACFATLLSGHAGEEWHGTSYRADGLCSYFIYAAVFICAGSLKTEKIRQRLLQLFSLTGNLMAILIILQDLDAGVVNGYFPYLRAGIFFNTNHCAYYLTMTILCLIGLYMYESRVIWKVIYSLSLTVQFYSLLLNDTFGCFLAVWFGSLVLLILYAFSGRKICFSMFIPAVIMLALTVGLSDISSNNMSIMVNDVQDIIEKKEGMEHGGSGRIELWKNAIEKTIQSPIFGYGPEGLYYAFPDSVLNDRPHNEYLQYAVFLGIPGLLFYLASLITLAFKRIRELRTLEPTVLIAGGVMFGYLASAFFGNTMFYTSPYFFMIFGIVAFAGE